MKERPILFNSEMVKAVLDGRKTQTRRVMKVQPVKTLRAVYNGNGDWIYNGKHHKSPYGYEGDHLWVRENWGYKGQSHCPGETPVNYKTVLYHADQQRVDVRFKSFKSACDAGPRQNIKYPEGFSDLDEYTRGRIRDRLITDWWISKGKIPSIHMPRWASRIQLEITDVRAERVNDISNEDILAEGSTVKEMSYNNKTGEPLGFQYNFKTLWDSINEKRGYGWASNPWVWVVDFKRIDK